MIDIHIHILPGVDDGSFSLEESLAMARMAVESGVTEMITTPHCNRPDGSERFWAPDFVPRVRDFQQELDRADIPLKVYTGMEVFGTPEAPELLQDGLLMPLAQSGYLLIEFYFDDYGREATRTLEEIRAMGYTPIVAHPERYRYVQHRPELLNIWTDMGCLLQCNRGSLLGRFGPGPERMAYRMLDRGFPSFIASDAHRSTVRTPWLDDVYRITAEEYSPATARRLLEDNPRHVLNNERIMPVEPDWF